MSQICLRDINDGFIHLKNLLSGFCLFGETDIVRDVDENFKSYESYYSCGEYTSYCCGCCTQKNNPSLDNSIGLCCNCFKIGTINFLQDSLSKSLNIGCCYCFNCFIPCGCEICCIGKRNIFKSGCVCCHEPKN